MIPFVQRFGQAARLAPEHEDDVLRSAQWRVPEEARGLCREEERLTERRQFLLEGIPAWPHPKVDILPVVEASSLYLPFVEREPQRLHEMQRRADGEAGATRVPRVPVNLGMNQDNVQGQGASLRGSRAPGKFPKLPP